MAWSAGLAATASATSSQVIFSAVCEPVGHLLLDRRPLLLGDRQDGPLGGRERRLLLRLEGLAVGGLQLGHLLLARGPIRSAMAFLAASNASVSALEAVGTSTSFAAAKNDWSR